MMKKRVKSVRYAHQKEMTEFRRASSSSLSYPARKAHVPCYTLIHGLPGS